MWFPVRYLETKTARSAWEHAAMEVGRLAWRQEEKKRSEGRDNNKNRKDAGDNEREKKFSILDWITRMERETRILPSINPHETGEEVSL